MTGAIISEYYTGNSDNRVRHFIVTGSFFFVEPDLAITVYTNLCEERSQHGIVYADDYLYFGQECNLLNDSQNGELVNCLWIQREWLKEMPEKNITEIHFERAVTRKYYKRADHPVKEGEMVIAEGYYGKNFIYPLEDENEDVEFLRFKTSKEEDVSLCRIPAEIIEVHNKDCISSDYHFIDDISVLYTNIHPLPTLLGGPILEFETNRVVGMLSHCPDDPYDKGGIRGVFI